MLDYLIQAIYLTNRWNLIESHDVTVSYDEEVGNIFSRLRKFGSNLRNQKSDLWEKDELIFKSQSLGFLHGSVGKESAGNVVDLGSIPGLGSSPGEGKDYPLQYSGLEIPWTV